MEDYNNLTIDKLNNIIDDIFKNRVINDSSKIMFSIGTRKEGVLEYHKALYKHINYTQEEIDNKIKLLDESLEDGFYIIDENGVTKQ